MGGFPDLSGSDTGASLALFYRREYGIKSLRMVRYRFHPNAAYSTDLTSLLPFLRQVNYCSKGVVPLPLVDALAIAA